MAIETPFVHLHNHTEFSLLDGACKINKMVAMASEMGMPAVAMTDHGNMFGAVDFYKAAKKEGIKPIIGQEFYVAPESRFNKKQSRNSDKKNNYHLVLLAKNNTGYKNIIKLSSLGYIDGFYYKPRIDKEIMAKYSEGIIATSACVGGEISQHILHGEEGKLKKAIGDYIDIFGMENYFLEFMDHGLKEEKIVNKRLIDLSNKYGIQRVVTNDCHYLKKEDAKYHDVMLAIQTGARVHDKNRFRFASEEFYFKSYEEMKQLFSNYPDMYSNTLKIMEMCNVSYTFGENLLPVFEVPDGYNQTTYLRKLGEEGLRNKYNKITDEVRDRFEYEFKVIEDMGFVGYFLIVWDLIYWSKTHDIFIGPGRGSAGGSILAYALDITDIDPLKYNLIFERFLNPERVSMPDIDIDIQDTKRDQVINYVTEKYGEDHVAYIAAFDQLKAKNALRDAARSLDFTASESMDLTKLINEKSLEKSYQNDEKFKEIVDTDQRVAELVDYSKYLEGQYRHTSLHAAGIVITPDPVDEIVPLFVADQKKKTIATQFEKNAGEELGLLKMDFLGLRNLSILQLALKLIEERHGKHIELNEIPIDDKKSFEILQAGNTFGCFQVESPGMKKLLRRLKPEHIDEIIAVLALYRPGPLESGYVDDYIERKKDPSKITYPFDVLEPILKDTYGVIVYQEQIMKTAMSLSGFTGGEADILRKAIGKKKGDLIEKMKIKFIDGAVKNGYDKQEVENLYANIEKFAKYCFNKSHSAAYAYITMYTSYLKANYTIEYMVALLRSIEQDIKEVSKYIEDTRKQEIKVLQPSINKSFVHFEIEDTNIRYGLCAIKGVGELAAKIIVKEREKNGKYESIIDFIRRVDVSKINKRVLETLTTCGAFDEYGIERNKLLQMVPNILEFAVRAKDRVGGLFSADEDNYDKVFFDNLMEKNESVIPFEDKDIYEIEQTQLGDFISRHPFDGSFNEIYYYNNKNFDSLLESSKNGTIVTVLGYIKNFEKRQSKKRPDKSFLLIDLSLYFTDLRLFYFEPTPEFEEKISKFYEPMGFKLKVRKSYHTNRANFNIEEIFDKDELEKAPCSSVEITIKKDATKDQLIELKKYLDKNPGNTEVNLLVENGVGKYKITDRTIDSEIIEDIKKLDFVKDALQIGFFIQAV